MNFAVS